MSAPHLGVVPAADTHLSLSLSLAVVHRAAKLAIRGGKCERGKCRRRVERRARNLFGAWQGQEWSRGESYRHRSRPHARTHAFRPLFQQISMVAIIRAFYASSLVSISIENIGPIVSTNDLLIRHKSCAAISSDGRANAGEASCLLESYSIRKIVG